MARDAILVNTKIRGYRLGMAYAALAPVLGRIAPRLYCWIWNRWLVPHVGIDVYLDRKFEKFIPMDPQSLRLAVRRRAEGNA